MALTDNLVSYYKLDETTGTNANDEVSTNDGTLTSATRTTGKINNGTAFFNAFDTKTQYISLPTATFSDTMSISFWTSTSAETGKRYMLPFSYESAGNIAMRVTFGTSSGNYNNVSVIVGVGTQAVAEASNVLLRDGTRQHRVATKTKTGSTYYLELFLNGNSVATGNANATNFTPNATYPTLGANASAGGGYTGKIDEVGIRNRALSATEATALYNAGTGLQYPFSTGVTFIPKIIQF